MAGPDLPKLQCTACNAANTCPFLPFRAPERFFGCKSAAGPDSLQGVFNRKSCSSRSFYIMTCLVGLSVVSGHMLGKLGRQPEVVFRFSPFAILFFCASLSDLPLLSSGGRPGILPFVYNLSLCSQGLLTDYDYRKSLELAVPYPTSTPQLFELPRSSCALIGQCADGARPVWAPSLTDRLWMCHTFSALGLLRHE